MTDTEQKALALVNEVGRERKDATLPHFYTRANHHFVEALCRAIEQHEAFRQEVSDAVEGLLARETPAGRFGSSENLRRFIIAKPDTLVEALDEALWEVSNVKLTDRELRAVSLRLNAKCGGKIEGEG